MFGDRCYFSRGIENVDRQEYKDAQDYCAREVGGHLFHITSQAAQCKIVRFDANLINDRNGFNVGQWGALQRVSVLLYLYYNDLKVAIFVSGRRHLC